MAERSSTKALRIPTILDEVTWLVHAGSCTEPECQRDFDIGDSCHLVDEHLQNLLNCIMVSKIWAKIAIPQLWGRYAHEKHLFSVIADVPCSRKWYNEHYYYNRETINAVIGWYSSGSKLRADAKSNCPFIMPSRMDSWNFYAKYVKKLQVKGHDFIRKGDLPILLPTITALSGRQPILPSLKTVMISGVWMMQSYAPYVLSSLLSSITQQLEIDYYGIVEPEKGCHFEETIKTIQCWAPNLTRLALHRCLASIKNVQSYIHPVLCEFLPDMKSLQVILLDSKCASPDLLLAIADLPRLRVLDLDAHRGSKDFEHYLSPIPLTTSMSRSNKVFRGFPSLAYLVFPVGGKDCCELEDTLLDAFGPDHHLQHLAIKLDTVHIGEKEYEECASSFCATPARVFPEMRVFHLNLHESDFFPVDVDDLQTLCKCRNLIDLQISGVILSSSTELTRILSCLPGLTNLKLLGPPMRLAWDIHRDGLTLGPEERREDADVAQVEALSRGDVGGLDLASLIFIMVLLPRLEHLALSVVARPTATLRREILPFDHLRSLEIFGSFHNFQLLEFDTPQAAHYLCSFLRPSTQFIFTSDYSLEDQLKNEVDDPGSIWDGYSKAYGKFVEYFVELVEETRSDREQV
jgi:hypothetical protein